LAVVHSDIGAGPGQSHSDSGPDAATRTSHKSNPILQVSHAKYGTTSANYQIKGIRALVRRLYSEYAGKVLARRRSSICDLK